MRSLFAKIFLSFFVTVLVLATLLQLSTMTRSTVLESPGVRDLIARQATAAVDAYLRGGALALRQAVEGLPGPIVLLDAKGNVVGDVPAGSESIVAGAGSLLASPGAPPVRLVVRRDVIVEPVVSRTGESYYLVMKTPHERALAVLATLDQHPAIRVSILVFVAGVVCFLLARHITAPLVRLGATAGQMAEGRLDARAGRALTKRHDEIGALGRDFDQMADRLAALVGSERQLLADVSHELRSPLARLTVAVGLARQREGRDTTAELDRIEKEVQRLDTIIGQSLTLARIESGVGGGPMEECDLTSLVQEIAADGDFEARASGRRVVMLTADPCIVVGVAELLRSAVENVVRNAIRYTTSGDSVEVDLKSQGHSARILVRDHGPGIPEAQLRDVFLPFRRVEAPNRPRSNGAGLGLAIADRVVRLHGGTITASNGPSGGLSVEIRLPVSDERS
jgi:signal transduction histidine kinase